MANLFDIVKTFRPRRVILAEDGNDIQEAVKASFDQLGEAPAVGRNGVSTPFAVGEAVEPYHAVTKSAMDDAETGATTSAAESAASAAAAVVSASTATTQASAASASASAASGSASSASTSAGTATTQAAAASGSATAASTSAGTAATQAAAASASAAASAASAASVLGDSTEALAAAVATAADRAATEAVAGDVAAIALSGFAQALPGSVMIVDADGLSTTKQIAGFENPGNSVQLDSTATTGMVLLTTTEAAFTPSMSRFMRVFVPATMTSEITIFKEGLFGIYVTTDKRFRVNHDSTYESEVMPVSDDFVAISFDLVDDETSSVVVAFYVNGEQFGDTITASYSDLYLQSQLDAEDGFFFLASPGHSTSTNAGLLKTNLPTDTVGLQYDLGANAINLSQATSAARPLLGRVPEGGRRNLLTYSQQFENAVWLRTSCSVLANSVIAPDGTLTGDTLVASAGVVLPAIYQNESTTTTRVLSLYAKAGSYDYIKVNPRSSTGVGGAVIDLTTGTVTGISVTTAPLSVTTTDEGDGWWRIALATTSGGSTQQLRITLSTNPDNSVAETFIGTETIYLWGAGLELGSTVTAYQKVVTARDITQEGVADQWYLYFDRSDDALTGTVPAITGGTAIIAGRDGIWIDTDYSCSAGTFSLGTTSFTGGPAAALAVVGDIVGGFITSAVLSTAVIAQMVEFFKRHGAPGYFELGAETVTNGTFDSDVAGWSAWGSTILWSAGAVSITQTASNGAVQQLNTTVSSTKYLLTCDFSATTANTRLKAQTGSGYNSGLLASVETTLGTGSLSLLFTATTTATYVRCELSGGSNTGNFDNISLKALTLNTGAYV